ncbi:MAG: hypothetical protein IAE94_05250 [Chthoniobacterales bacterium]|nr:hypothetical protein [Chthoniobacterales bacterium]
MNSLTLPSQSVLNDSQFSELDCPINKRNKPVIAFRNPNETCYSDKFKTSPVRRSVADDWLALDKYQRMVMAQLNDVLEDLRWFLQPRLAGELVRGNEYGPKPLAEIRWQLTAPVSGLTVMIELADLVVWPAYQKRALNLLERAEEINPHLTSELWEYLTQPIEDEDDGEEWVVPILPDLGDGGRRAYAGRLVNLAPPRVKKVSQKAKNGRDGKSTHNITVSPNYRDNGLLFPLPEKGERRPRKVVRRILTDNSGLVQGELFGEGELK